MPNDTPGSPADGGTAVDETAQRIQELRAMRGISQQALAELAGFTKSYLSQIENGHKPVQRRATLEALAAALRVAPSELTGQPYPPTDAAQVTGHEASSALRAVLRDIEIEAPTGPAQARPLPEVQQEVAEVRALSDASDYASIANAVPRLVGELHAAAATEHNTDVLRLLAHALHAAFYLAKDLGHGDLAWTVAGHLHKTAQAISEPEWIGLAQFIRSHAMVGTGARRRAFALSEHQADEIAGIGGLSEQVEGMLHLSSAMHAAALREADTSADHLHEADEIARVNGEGSFADLHFGPRNVGVWRVALAVELGEGGRARELASDVDAASIPSAGRRAMFYADVGRGMATERATRVPAVETLLRAEDTAPQMIRTNFYVRQTVVELLGRRLPSGTARDLRGLAYRMGIGARAPSTS